MTAPGAVQCRLCGGCQDIYLTAGKLYCLFCLPTGGLPVAQRYLVLYWRNQAVRAASAQRREERKRG